MVRIAAGPATLQNLVLYTQVHSSYNIYVAETNKYQSHRGHIVYCMKNRNEKIQNSRISGLPGILTIQMHLEYKLFISLPVPSNKLGSSSFHWSSVVMAKLLLFPSAFGAIRKTLMRLDTKVTKAEFSSLFFEA